MRADLARGRLDAVFDEARALAQIQRVWHYASVLDAADDRRWSATLRQAAKLTRRAADQLAQ
jgi:hypothetical protein